MRDILEEIIAHKRVEVDRMRAELPLSTLEARVLDLAKPVSLKESLTKPVSMKAALAGSRTGIIAEFKRKSPSKGWIHRDAKASEVPLAYQNGGASALSILTDSEYFGGSDEYIMEARNSGVTLPILYKNFVIDQYQLFQARLCGASAVLLIAAAMDKEDCGKLLSLAHELDLEVLLEMHNERDLEYAALEPDLYGINNRNLGSFITDVAVSERLAGKLPQGEVWVSESGIGSPETVRQLRGLGYKGFLIGESFMKNDDPGRALSQFIERC